MSGALFSFTAMAVAARELSHGMGPFQMLVVRSGFGVVLVTLLLARAGFAQLRVTHFKLHVTRNLIHFCGQLGWFYAIGLIPLATVFAIEFTTPLWTAVFAAIFLREQLTAVRITAVVLGITGILVILRPGLATVEPAALAMLVGARLRPHAYRDEKTLVARFSAVHIVLDVVHAVRAGAGAGARALGAARRRAMAVGGAARHHRHQRAFLHGQCAGLRGCDSGGANGFSAPAARRFSWLFFLRRDHRRLAGARRAAHSWRQRDEFVAGEQKQVVYWAKNRARRSKRHCFTPILPFPRQGRRNLLIGVAQTIHFNRDPPLAGEGRDEG
jgi:uncharacterized membrane protein